MLFELSSLESVGWSDLLQLGGEMLIPRAVHLMVDIALPEDGRDGLPKRDVAYTDPNVFGFPQKAYAMARLYRQL